MAAERLAGRSAGCQCRRHRANAGLGFAAPPPGDTLVQGRVYLDNGATVDVAGLSDVQLPISDILVTIPLIGANELADSPLLRNSFLNGLKDVVIDSTLSGTNADGEAWVGSPSSMPRAMSI